MDQFGSLPLTIEVMEARLRQGEVFTVRSAGGVSFVRLVSKGMYSFSGES